MVLKVTYVWENNHKKTHNLSILIFVCMILQNEQLFFCGPLTYCFWNLPNLQLGCTTVISRQWNIFKINGIIKILFRFCTFFQKLSKVCQVCSFYICDRLTFIDISAYVRNRSFLLLQEIKLP